MVSVRWPPLGSCFTLEDMTADLPSETMASNAETALFLAIRGNDADLIRELIGANPNLLRAVSPMGVSPVLFATYYQKHDMARLLIELGAPLDVFEAAATGETARVQEIIQQDPALANATSADGFSPLGLAAFFGWEGVAALLLSRGADVNFRSQNNMGVQPLHSAVAGKHAALARTLVQAGADVNATQQDGFTPLMGAAQNGDVELVEFLLLHGADTQAVTHDGRTAASLALEEGHSHLATRLNPPKGN